MEQRTDGKDKEVSVENQIVKTGIGVKADACFFYVIEDCARFESDGGGEDNCGNGRGKPPPLRKIG